jgi:hypothetical protein
MNERKRAIQEILYALRNPLVVMSIPDRERVKALAEEHNVTALDLLDYTHYRASRT